MAARKAYIKVSMKMMNNFTTCANNLVSFITKKVASVAERRTVSASGGGGCEGKQNATKGEDGHKQQ